MAGDVTCASCGESGMLLRMSCGHSVCDLCLDDCRGAWTVGAPRCPGCAARAAARAIPYWKLDHLTSAAAPRMAAPAPQWTWWRDVAAVAVRVILGVLVHEVFRRLLH
jgi:hypothetical protein